MTEQSQHQIPATPVDEISPPPVPRAVTSLINKRAWTEPSVRVWWLASIAVLAVFAFYAGDRLWDRAIVGRLIREGTVVQATMVGNAVKAIHGQLFLPGDIIYMQFDWDGQERRDLGPIHRQMAVGEKVTIHVDRNDPGVWTDLTDTETLLATMFVGFLFLPAAPILFVVARFKQRALLAQWINGEAAAAVVHERKQTPIAPLSYAIRCSLRDQRDKRLFTVYIPQSTGKNLDQGSTIWVVTSYRQSRSVAAMWFE